jgi:uncharacterized protein
MRKNGWAGGELAIGDSRIAVTIPAMRCVMTMLEQPGVPKDSSVLRTIVRDSGQTLGVYANIMRGGRIALGDAVTLL